MDNKDKRVPSDLAKAMAEALEREGGTSAEPDTVFNPHWIAQEAFARCYGRSPTRFNEFKDRMGYPSKPVPGYYSKLAEYCQRAYRKADEADELREQFAYGWGYWSGFADSRKGA